MSQIKHADTQSCAIRAHILLFPFSELFRDLHLRHFHVVYCTLRYIIEVCFFLRSSPGPQFTEDLLSYSFEIMITISNRQRHITARGVQDEVLLTVTPMNNRWGKLYSDICKMNMSEREFFKIVIATINFSYTHRAMQMRLYRYVKCQTNVPAAVTRRKISIAMLILKECWEGGSSNQENKINVKFKRNFSLVKHIDRQVQE